VGVSAHEIFIRCCATELPARNQVTAYRQSYGKKGDRGLQITTDERVHVALRVHAHAGTLMQLCSCGSQASA
jgi:hypothetical protein